MSSVCLKTGCETRVVGDDVRGTSRSQITRTFSAVLTETISHWRVLSDRMKSVGQWSNTAIGIVHGLDGVIEMVDNIKDRGKE